MLFQLGELGVGCKNREPNAKEQEMQVDTGSIEGLIAKP